ncbi:hypothetical protein EBB07_24970 [Paenibacillaceae bacterium]|nr:hypothetical protein EBB07_24970 [Paenibacillaceae bacterium]
MMLKWNKEKIKGFTLGVFTTVLSVSLIGSAVAAGKLTTIKVVQDNIKLFVDGKLVKPTDVKGNVIEPFIYDGTTYLPLRSLSNALTNNQKPVSWDAKTSSIYVGQAPVAAQTDIAEVEPYATNGRVYTGENASIRILDKTLTPFNKLEDSSYFTYILDSNYSQLNGQLVVPYTSLGSTEKGAVVFYSVDKKGVETKIAEFTTEAGDDPIPVTVDLRGVEILKIVTAAQGAGYGALYNVTLSGIK